MKIILILLFSFSLHAQKQLNLSHNTIKAAHRVPFVTHQSQDKTSFNNALAMNIDYQEIKSLRRQIEKVIAKKLDFFKGWKKAGEAHVTVITPPEYVFALNKYLTMGEINQIARKNSIQKSDLKILGIGSGSKVIDGKKEETFFLIVDSINLRRIRHAIYQKFVQKGGDKKAFDPSWFFPHITIGYTKKDLHASDGVLKNLKHSFDKRFKLN